MGNTESLSQVLPVEPEGSSNNNEHPEYTEDKNKMCPVCLEEYNTTSKPQVPFQCGHSVCQECITTLNQFHHTHCPLCRRMINSTFAQAMVKSAIPLQTGSTQRVTNMNRSRQHNSSTLAFKFIVIGDSNIGKTSLIHRFSEGNFLRLSTDMESEACTIKRVKIEEKVAKLSLWDIKAEIGANNPNPSCYRESDGVILCYDITNRDSFSNLEKWIKEVKENCERDVRMILIGTKSDLESERAISYHEGKAFAESHGFSFFEVSSQDGNNVEETF